MAKTTSTRRRSLNVDGAPKKKPSRLKRVLKAAAKTVFGIVFRGIGGWR